MVLSSVDLGDVSPESFFFNSLDMPGAVNLIQSILLRIVRNTQYGKKVHRSLHV